MNHSHFPIDIVYTWCDDQDPTWSNAKLTTLQTIDATLVTNNGIVEALSES